MTYFKINSQIIQESIIVFPNVCADFYLYFFLLFIYFCYLLFVSSCLISVYPEIEYGLCYKYI